LVPVPRWLQKCILRGLAADAQSRWPTIEALEDTVVRGLRRPQRIFIVGAAALTLIAALPLVTRNGTRADEQRSVGRPSLVQATFDGNAAALGLSPDGKTLAYQSGSSLHVLDLTTRKEHTIGPLTLTGAISSVSWLANSSAFDLITGSTSYRVEPSSL